GLAAATAKALAAAQQAVSDLRWRHRTGLGAPASTIVMLVSNGDELAIGWVGDSRAYWLGGEPAVLTEDNSWANRAVTKVGTAPPTPDPHAPTITRWLGADAPDGPDQIVSFVAPGPGWIVACSDGLWNHAPDAGDLAGPVRPPGSASAAAVARSLT